MKESELIGKVHSAVYHQYRNYETDPLLCKEIEPETVILLLQAVEREEKAWT